MKANVLQIPVRLSIVRSSSDEPKRTLVHNAFSNFSSGFSSAQSVVNSTSTFSWNSLIRSLTRAHSCETAIALFPEMLSRAIEPDSYTFTFLVKACTENLHIQTAVSVHGQVIRRGFTDDVYVRTALADFYCKSGEVRSARNLFETMPQRDVVSWNTMIDGLVRSGDCEGALDLLGRMQAVGLQPNRVTLLNLFPAVCELKDGSMCRELHGFAIRRSMGSSVCNGLIDAYSKCGEIEFARQVFDGMTGVSDAVTWGSMISGYVHNGYFCEALDLFDKLRAVDTDVNHVSVVNAIVAATELEDLERGIGLHDYAVLKAVHRDVQVVTALITFYARCGNVEKAGELFNRIHEKDVVAWCAMISAFSQHGCPREASYVFLEMQEAGIKPNRVSLVSILPACVELSNLRLGKSVHSYAIRSMLGLNKEVGTALVGMYAKCGDYQSASSLFGRMQHKDIVAWNALLHGYAQSGDAFSAVKTFHELWSLGLRPDRATMVGVLPACAILNALDQGMAVHAIVIKGRFDNDILVKNAVIDLYAKCGNIQAALFWFNEYGCSDNIISWNTIISGFMHGELAKEAIDAFYKMLNEGLKANMATIVIVLPATAKLGALKDGMTLHSIVIRLGFENYLPMGNSLIDMYSKCGRLNDARDLFNHMIGRDTVSWNAMITGYALNGMVQDALSLFSQMQESHVDIDKVSFVGVLSACRHGGLIEESKELFEAMRSEYGLEPNLEHYSCMVDLLGRAGQLNEAWDLIQEMPMQADASVWGAFLDACRLQSNLQMGKMALDKLVGLDSEDAGPYVVMSGICAQHEKWMEARSLRKTARNAGLGKVPGCSWL